jgi:hypothetical protein
MNGDSIPTIPFGELFRIVPNINNKHILGISTRYGPIMVHGPAPSELEFIMNASLKPYIQKMQKQESAGDVRCNILDQWLGWNQEPTFNTTSRTYLNIGQMVERDLK